MCPCSSCHGAGAGPRASLALIPLPSAIPQVEDQGLGWCCALASAAMRVPRSPRDAQSPLGWAAPWHGACLPTHLWGNPPCPLAHTGDMQLPRGIPSVLPSQQAGHWPHRSADAESCSHTGFPTPPIQLCVRRAPQGFQCSLPALPAGRAPTAPAGITRHPTSP